MEQAHCFPSVCHGQGEVESSYEVGGWVRSAGRLWRSARAWITPDPPAAASRSTAFHIRCLMHHTSLDSCITILRHEDLSSSAECCPSASLFLRRPPPSCYLRHWIDE